MVYGTAFCPLSMLEQVKNLGVAGRHRVVGWYRVVSGYRVATLVWCISFHTLRAYLFLFPSHMLLTDSKVLAEEKREAIFKQVLSEDVAQWLGWKVEVLSPNFISNAMLQRCVVRTEVHKSQRNIWGGGGS